MTPPGACERAHTYLLRASTVARRTMLAPVADGTATTVLESVERIILEVVSKIVLSEQGR